MEPTGGYIRTEAGEKLLVIHPNEPVVTKEEAEALLRYNIDKKLTQLARDVKITMPDKMIIESFPEFMNQESLPISFEIKFLDKEGNEIKYEPLD